MAVTYATTPMGGDHTAGWVVAQNLEAFGGTVNYANNNGGTNFRLGGTGVGGNVPAPGAAQAGFDAFRNSTGYNFRLNEGQRAITNNQAVRGMLNSGATLKGLTRFGQGVASEEFGNYLNTLLGQQSLGANAASAQAGVANNFSSQVQQNNAQNASNIGNAALARAGNNNQFLSSLLSAGGYALGGRG
jgi:hypothetical protein